MIVGAFEIITVVVTWGLKTGIPALFKHHVQAKQTQVELAKDLCDNHDDCEAQKALAMQGTKPVARLKPVEPKPAPEVTK